VKLKIIHASVGAVTEDRRPAGFGFGRRLFSPSICGRTARRPDLAQRENVEIRQHSVIYEVSDEIKLGPWRVCWSRVYKETHLGRAEVRNTFRVKGSGVDRGLLRVDGLLKRDAEVRVIRDGRGLVHRPASARCGPVQGRCQRSPHRLECGVGVSKLQRREGR